MIAADILRTKAVIYDSHPKEMGQRLSPTRLNCSSNKGTCLSLAVLSLAFFYSFWVDVREYKNHICVCVRMYFSLLFICTPVI